MGHSATKWTSTMGPGSSHTDVPPPSPLLHHDRPFSDIPRALHAGVGKSGTPTYSPPYPVSPCSLWSRTNDSYITVPVNPIGHATKMAVNLHGYG